MSAGNVVAFPTGRPVESTSPRRATVAALARKLVAGSRHLRLQPGRHLLSVELQELTGVADRTMDGLAALARSRVLTPATAVRLAMRHAVEIGVVPPGAYSPLRTGSEEHFIVCMGDAYGRFALRIEDHASRAWVARGHLADLELLRRLCPSWNGSLRLLHGLDPNGRPTIEVGIPRNRRDAPDLVREGSGAFEARQVLIVGGLPRSSARRRLAVAGIKNALRSSGILIRSTVASCCDAAAGEEQALEAARHIALIAIACPGFVRAQGETR